MRSWNLLAGADVQRVEGTSTDALAAGMFRIGGGSQLQHGTFAQFDAGTRRQNCSSALDISSLEPTAISSVRAAGSRRAGVCCGHVDRHIAPFGRLPSTSYFATSAPATRRRDPIQRYFRRHLFGAEVGFDVVAESAHFGVSLYRNQIDDVITNVTVSSTPQLIVRQRRNAAEALTRGVDVQADYRWRAWRLDLGYLFADSRFSTGERIPQVPKHAGNAQLTSRPPILSHLSDFARTPCSMKMTGISSNCPVTEVCNSAHDND